MDSCIFCKIAAKELNSKVVYEDEFIFAFYDVNPVAPVHVLIIPKQHLPSLADVGEGEREILGWLQIKAAEIARKLGLEDTGYRVVSNCGLDGGQTVNHLHYHLLGGRTMQWPPG